MKKGYLGAILVVLVLTGSTFAGPEPDGSMRVWLDGEYLLWWLKPAPVSPPLLTTGPLTNPISLGSGILGQPNTQVLAGDSNLNQGPFSGFRVGAGWINCDNSFGVDGNFFYLSQRGTSFGFNSDEGGNPVLARPIVDARGGNETVLFVSAPNAFNGSLNIASTTNLYGFDANMLLPIERNGEPDEVTTYLTALGGFRYLNLRDGLTISQSSAVIGNGISFFDGQPLTAGSNIAIADTFRTLNQFYGGQIGVRGGISWWRFTVNGTAKVALGTMREEAKISGSTAALDPTIGLNAVTSGGLYALPSNSGSFTRNILAVVPEGNLWFSVEITPQIRLMMGYTILYFSNVARPGDLINRSVDRTKIPSSQAFNAAVPGPSQPSFNWSGTDFWAQGINFGLSLRF
ncbi:MAG TPA: BBP7 family outer membrane beta-barrel protein [Gemmataceae bacterium]|jgi:hypothetical protein